MLSDAELGAIEERVGKATPGPWIDEYSSVVTPSDDPHNPIHLAHLHDDEYIENHNWPNDAPFIAHAREDIPRLLAEVRRLRAELAQARKWSGAWKQAAKSKGSAFLTRLRNLMLSVDNKSLRAELARYKWTRVSEGLPEQECDCLAIYQAGSTRWVEKMRYCADETGNSFPCYVTHWMHIPPAEGE